MKKLICYARTFKYTLLRFIETGWLVPYISGHMYQEQKNGTLKCMVCGDKTK